MRRYETFLIMDPDLSQDQRDQVNQRVAELITQMDGYLVFTDVWGDRKLAYDIKKRSNGYYVRFDYCGQSSLVNEIERFFRIDDRALKYMTVLLDKTVDLDKVKEEQAEAARKAKIEQTPEEAPREAETAPIKDSEAVEAETPAEGAPPSDESDSVTDTTPLKKPEEA